MKNVFVCSLCQRGIIGGALYLDETSLTYKTNKLTVDKEYRHLTLQFSEIRKITWKTILFPIATVHMTDGAEYKFLIFNKKRFKNRIDSVIGTIDE